MDDCGSPPQPSPTPPRSLGSPPRAPPHFLSDELADWCAPLPLSHALAALAGLAVEMIVFAVVVEPTAAGPSAAAGSIELAFDLVLTVLQVDDG